jgi:radical SAM protein with 4Fe4S-binding SPASM domain
MAVSLYAGDSYSHNAFCGRKGAFEQTVKGIQNIRRAGIALQINFTLCKSNFFELEKVAELAISLEAIALHIFFLVPTGRGSQMIEDELSASEYEEAFGRLCQLEDRFSTLKIKVTCAPHYFRVLSQQGRKSRFEKGCLAGKKVCFVSYKGEVFGCGYLPVSAGNLREKSFREIWLGSQLFKILREEDNLDGKCGICEYRKICSGCRARAYSLSGNFLGEEPKCIYQPHI